MSRPAPTPVSAAEVERRQAICLQLREYFDRKLEIAKAAKPGATVIWPTVSHFCTLVRIKHDHLRAWAKNDRFPFAKQAIEHCRAVRDQLATMDLPGAVFDSRAHLLQGDKP